MLDKDIFDIITNTISRSQGHKDVGQGHLWHHYKYYLKVSRSPRCWTITPLTLLQILSQGLKVTIEMWNNGTFDIITNSISRSQGYQDVEQGLIWQYYKDYLNISRSPRFITMAPLTLLQRLSQDLKVTKNVGAKGHIWQYYKYYIKSEQMWDNATLDIIWSLVNSTLYLHTKI